MRGRIEEEGLLAASPTKKGTEGCLTRKRRGRKKISTKLTPSVSYSKPHTRVNMGKTFAIIAAGGKMFELVGLCFGMAHRSTQQLEQSSSSFFGAR